MNHVSHRPASVLFQDQLITMGTTDWTQGMKEGTFWLLAPHDATPTASEATLRVYGLDTISIPITNLRDNTTDGHWQFEPAGDSVSAFPTPSSSFN